MSPETYNRARNLFLQGLPLNSAERQALLESECGPDDALRDYVQTLWENDVDDTALPERLESHQVVERAHSDLTGRTAGPYRIIERVGEGGMGSVYRAVDDTLDRPAALKFPALSLIGDAAARKRFEREAKVAAALDHPNICAVYGTGELDGHPYIAMAFLEGRTVEAMIQNGPLPVEEALDIALQAARGLSAAHGRGVVHRDIKPSNVMVVEQGGRRLAKIMDFGVAYLENATRLTLTPSPMGTAAYMAPEQTYSDDVDARADTWSLGAVLYEMLTGRRAFEAKDQYAVIDAIRTKQPAPLSSLRGGLPPALGVILAAALAKDRADRYGTVDEMAKDLAGLRADAGTVRPPRRLHLPHVDHDSRTCLRADRCRFLGPSTVRPG